MDNLYNLLGDNGFMPHGHCFLWTPKLLWLNIISDSLIALAYLTIPVTLIYFIYKRRDIPFNWIFAAFGIFILACGGTHMMDIWTTWYPNYWLFGYVKAITAAASVITAFLLVKLVPVALLIPSRRQLEGINEKLTQTNAELQNVNRRLEQTHDQLLQREKMAALGELVAGIAHEINTPVGIIVTSASLLAQQTDTLQDSYQQKTLAEGELMQYLSTAEESTALIQANATRAAELIQSFKQVAVDQTAGEQRHINMTRYIDETLASLAPALKKSAATIKVSGPSNLTLTTYPGALAQILANLVLNSLMHGFTEGEPGHIHIAVATKEEKVILTYRDNGNGIPAGLREKVFTPFFTTRRNAGGSGLGLHILYNLVTQTLNGEVRIEDPHRDKGVMFVIEFPLVNDALVTCEG